VRATAFPLALTLLLAASVASAAGGGGGGGAAGGGTVSSRDERATRKYLAGEKHRDRALEHASRAAAAESPSKREEYQRDARKEFERAIRNFESAARIKKDFAHAYNEIGFARRKLGDYAGALEAYDRALDIEPRLAQAIEYRGEAYLELGRLEDAKGAYMQLFRGARELADLLMEKMDAWVERHRDDPGDLDSESIEAFARWVEERAEIAQQTASVTGRAARSW
jgi:tetratricopeptide (TPR) repeat protein